MDSQTFEVLELPLFLRRLAGYAQSGPGRSRCLGLLPMTDQASVNERLDLVFEAKNYLSQVGSLGLGDVEDLEPLLEQLHSPASYLRPEQLLPVMDLCLASELVEYSLEKRRGDFPGLHRVASELFPVGNLGRRIKSIIGPGNSIAEDASPALGRRRKQVRSTRGRVQARLREFFKGEFGVQDEVIVERSGRYVIPVKASSRDRCPGIVHDVSRTQATVFVEPLDVVEDNNALHEAVRAVFEEEVRILIEVAGLIRDKRDELKANQAVLADLDALMAGARFAVKCRSTRPEVAIEWPVDLRRAVHPLLLFRQMDGGPEAIPINVRLAEGDRVLVLSGANAGGKTAALKTLGLLTLIAQCGLPITAADGSRLVLFQKILAVADEEQDLSGDRSTFSAHAYRLKEILDQAEKSSLVLLDELGIGTDPGEGTALGMAILDDLMARGSTVVVTTHYHGLKAYAAGREGAVNASVGFDQNTGRATYELRYGLPGVSNALAVAVDLGFDQKLVERAREYLPSGEAATKTLIGLLETALDRLRQRERELEELEAEAAGERDRAERIRQKLKRGRAKALDMARERAGEAVGRAERELRLLVRQAKESPHDQAAMDRARRELGRVKRQVERELRPPRTKKYEGPPLLSGEAGQTVLVAPLQQQGSLLEGFDRPSRVEVLVGQKKVEVNTSALREVADAPKPDGNGGVTYYATPTGMGSLNIVGQRVDEAISQVDRVLDRALLAGQDQVEIIHGVGSGVLRRAVHQHLARLSWVKSFDLLRDRPGGHGVTLVELR